MKRKKISRCFKIKQRLYSTSDEKKKMKEVEGKIAVWKNWKRLNVNINEIVEKCTSEAKPKMKNRQRKRVYMPTLCVYLTETKTV